jgi:hypothetical protein
MLALGFFLPLVLTALTVSWHNPDIRNIGIALVVSWAASNATAIWLPFDYRIIVYPVLEVVVGLAAAGGWLVMRFAPGGSRGGEGQLFAIAIVAFAALSVAACINYALLTTPGHGDKYEFVLLTNLCFAAECLLVGGWGVRDAYARAAGVSRVLRRSRVAAGEADRTETVGSQG